MLVATRNVSGRMLRAVGLMLALGVVLYGAGDLHRRSLGRSLIEAAFTGDESRLRSLLRQGADADWADEHGWTPLMVASARGHANVVGRLLRSGAEPNRRTRRGDYRAIRDVLYPHEIGSGLSDWDRFNPDLSDPNFDGGASALMLAVESGSERVVRLLLAAGADPALKDAGGSTALGLAEYRGRPSVRRLLREAAARNTARR